MTVKSSAPAAAVGDLQFAGDGAGGGHLRRLCPGDGQGRGHGEHVIACLGDGCGRGIRGFEREVKLAGCSGRAGEDAGGIKRDAGWQRTTDAAKAPRRRSLLRSRELVIVGLAQKSVGENRGGRRSARLGDGGRGHGEDVIACLGDGCGRGIRGFEREVKLAGRSGRADQNAGGIKRDAGWQRTADPAKAPRRCSLLRSRELVIVGLAERSVGKNRGGRLCAGLGERGGGRNTEDAEDAEKCRGQTHR